MADGEVAHEQEGSTFTNNEQELREQLVAAERRQRGLRADRLSNQMEHLEADQRVEELRAKIRDLGEQNEDHSTQEAA